MMVCILGDTLALQDSSVDLRLLQIPLSITSNTVLREGHASLALLEGEERETTTTRWPLGKLFNGFPSQNRSLHNNSAQLANSISRLTLYAKDLKKSCWGYLHWYFKHIQVWDFFDAPEYFDSKLEYLHFLQNELNFS